MEKISADHPHKYNMGLIGNCNYSALVDSRGRINWLCWPRFDSSFIFGSLLDKEKGGHFSISPFEIYTSSQKYVTNTNVLVTRFEAKDGVFEVVDFAPRFILNERFHKPLMLFRKIRRISGMPRVLVDCAPVGNYGELSPEIQQGSSHIRYTGLEATVRLTTNAPLSMLLQKREFTLAEDLYFVLSWGIPLEGPLISTFDDFLSRTIKYWHTWVEHCKLPRVFQEEVIRSALVLKLHQYEDTGAIIASCTTSLPEADGAGRNWDYRYCWLRDTYYTLHALNSLGHFEEAEKYVGFIENLDFGSLASLQPVYCIDGRREMPERELPLEGYRGNKPVRVGNGAVDQVQHDAYGQILLSLFNLFSDARLINRRRPTEKSLFSLIGYIEKTLEAPDNGVWEFRGKQALHSYSLLFHWAGSAACKNIAAIIGSSALSEKAAACMQNAERLLEKCYDPDQGAYMQSAGSRDLDASMLQMITLGFFEDKDKTKAITHLRAIQKGLEISPGFLHRYRHEDDFGQQKSAFLVCSFWFIEALVVLGFTEEATGIFSEVLKAHNQLGLFSEDFEIETNSQMGNFPQTYSHVGLINCAFALDKAMTRPRFL